MIESTSASHAAALAYATYGWRVVPILPGRKHPGLQEWQNRATTDIGFIDEWYATNPSHGVGIATGPESGIFVLDVDVADDKRGDETLEDLELSHGALPRTVECITGSGGKHLYFRYPADVEIRNDAGRKLGPGLDIRGIGGQVLAPPTIHPNGRPYAWEEEGDPAFTAVADAPGWLIKLLTVDDRPAPVAPAPERALAGDDGGPAARYNDATRWPDLLAADGWTLDHTDRSGEQFWVRPGKDRRDGASATVGWQGNDMLRVFTTAIPWLPERAYSRFGYYACRHHGGDRSAAARALVEAEQGGWDLTHLLPAPAAVVDVEGGTAEADDAPQASPDDPLRLVDWSTFWTRERAAQDWLLEPLIARGRGHALYAGAKSGKSLVMLAAAAALATGKRFLNNPPRPPQHVLYLDYEMTEDDLFERLESFGYGPDDDLSHLHYALLPSIAPLDTVVGADFVVGRAQALGAVHVVIDTTSRAVAGEENDADTFRTLYRLCGLRLKALGIGYHRLDHAGKDFEKGQRGSSAKNDDVDVVQQLVRRDGGIVIKATHRRMSWVPEMVELGITDEDGGTTYTSPEAVHPTGTWHAVKWLEEHAVPVGLGRDKVRKLMKEAGFVVRNDALAAALRLRRNSTDGTEVLEKAVPGTGFREASDNLSPASGDDLQTPWSERGTGAGTGGDRSPERTARPVPVSIETGQGDAAPDGSMQERVDEPSIDTTFGGLL